jgi:hypothetical protein
MTDITRGVPICCEDTLRLFRGTTLLEIAKLARMRNAIARHVQDQNIAPFTLLIDTEYLEEGFNIEEKQELKSFSALNLEKHIALVRRFSVAFNHGYINSCLGMEFQDMWLRSINGIRIYIGIMLETAIEPREYAEAMAAEMYLQIIYEPIH